MKLAWKQLALVALLFQSIYGDVGSDTSDVSGELKKDTTDIEIGAIRLRNKEIKNEEGTNEDIGVGDSKKDESLANEITLPDYLSVSDFDVTTSKMLTLVEFFSPYCSHCKALFPTWKETYQTYFQEMKDLGIQMRQVNCIESGDLCDREDVNFYPNLRLYLPVTDKETGDLQQGRSKFVGSFPRTLARTKENFMRYMKTSVAEYADGVTGFPSASIPLSVDDMLKIIAGEYDEAIFVTFFPATDQHWNGVDETNKNTFLKMCPECLDRKQLWDKLSNRVLSMVRTGHFNCFSNPKICEELGFKDLTSAGLITEPKFVMFLPKSSGLIRVDYNGEISLQKMKNFAFKLFENYQYETLSVSAMSDEVDLREELPHKPLKYHYPLKNKIAVIFFYDAETVSDEDKAILPYLLEYVTDSPFNIHLATGKAKKYEKTIRAQFENLNKFVNDVDDADPEFNQAMYLATTLTSKPTVLIFKDNSLLTSVFQSFAPEDIRNPKKLEQFIKKNQYPLYQELTPDLLDVYFNDGVPQSSDKVVITFINSNNEDETSNALYHMSLTAHKYYHSKKKYYFRDLSSKRETKNEKVKKLIEANADSVKVIDEMRKEIPHFFDNDDVLFTFIDLASVDTFDQVKNWKLKNRNYKSGDSIIISKDYTYYWDKAVNGEKLKNDPDMMHETLLSLLDPALVNNVELPKLLLGSPFGDSFRFMDKIHERGILGYVLLIAGVVLCRSFFKFVLRKRRTSSKPGLGIIGNTSKTD
ncbi:uncharacterized protein PRCAT00005446001 [Priceomyces carsonii]|uniref:uncharacterized protein n=1 Tax=Priceomyces carsonii TaxID=28549 RepID=UPI002EDA274A|nr:unnamed protein product [Priceomyces carsonii]